MIIRTGSWYRWDGNRLIIHVYVQPRAGRDHVAGVHGEALKICLTAPPVEGKANRQLVRYLARLFNVKPSQVAIVHGETARRKTLAITSPGTAPEQIASNNRDDL